MSTEKELREYVRRVWPGWVDGREPRGSGRNGWGSGNGAPDLLFAVGGRLLPVELKLASIVRGRFVFSEIREKQRKWHAGAQMAGVVTAVLGGVPLTAVGGGWALYVGRMGPEVRDMDEVCRVGETPGQFAHDMYEWYSRALTGVRLPVGEKAL